MTTRYLKAYEIDARYYNCDHVHEPILSQTVLEVTDNDDGLDRNRHADLGRNQTFEFEGEPAVQCYDIGYVDLVEVNQGGVEFETISMRVTFAGRAKKCYILSKDPNFDPSVGDSIHANSYRSFTGSDYDDVVSANCFIQGTRLLTTKGEVSVEDLREGDHLVTKDHGPQPLRWIGDWTHRFRRGDNEQKPITLSARAIDGARIHSAVTVSPQHRILLRDNLADLMFKKGEVLAPAKGLVEIPGVRRRKAVRKARYFALMLDRHEIVYANGFASESFYPGPMAMKCLGQNLRERMLDRFPELGQEDYDYGPFARPVLTVREATRYAQAANDCSGPSGKNRQLANALPAFA